jgi:phage tail-like protein
MSELRIELPTDNYIGAFNFRVTIPDIASGVNQAFTRVSGVVSQSEPMEFMHGLDPYVRRSAGRTTYEDVTMERIYNGHDEFYNWRLEVEEGIINRRDVVVELMRPDGTPVRKMKLFAAWPSRWELPEMDASGSSGAVERISLTVERVIEEPV